MVYMSIYVTGYGDCINTPVVTCIIQCTTEDTYMYILQLELR